MQTRTTTYSVIWQEPANGLATGKLVLGADELRLEGASEGRLVRRAIPFDDLARVRIGRAAEEQVNGRPALVLERRGASALLVGPLGAGLLSELADALAELSTVRGERLEHVAVVVPLKPGAVERARRLIAEGPPFDPAEAGLQHHHVFVSDREVVFVFDGADVSQTVRRLLSDPRVWRLTAAWSACLAGRPRLAEAAFSWPARDRET